MVLIFPRNLWMQLKQFTAQGMVNSEYLYFVLLMVGADRSGESANGERES